MLGGVRVTHTLGIWWGGGLGARDIHEYIYPCNSAYAHICICACIRVNTYAYVHVHIYAYTHISCMSIFMIQYDPPRKVDVNIGRCLLMW